MQFGGIALPLVAVLMLDASAAQVALLGTLGTLPWWVFGLAAGALVDRWRRRPVIVVAHLGRSALLASIPLAALLGRLTLAQLYVVAFGVGALSMFFETAYRSYLPFLVGRGSLADGNAKTALTDSMTRMAGPTVAGLVVQALTAAAALAVDAATYLASGLLVLRIRCREPLPERPSPVDDARSSRSRVRPALRTLTAGLAYAWGHRLVRGLTLAEATFVLGFDLGASVLMVFLVRDLGFAPALIGVVFGAGSVGGFTGALVARRLGDRAGRGRTAMLGAALRCVGPVALPFALFVGPLALPLLVVSRFVHAAGWTLWEVHQTTLQQAAVPDRMLGRVTASSLFVVNGAATIGAGLGAAIAASAGTGAALAVGSVIVLACLPFLLGARLTRVRDLPTPYDDESRACAARSRQRPGATRSPASSVSGMEVDQGVLASVAEAFELGTPTGPARFAGAGVSAHVFELATPTGRWAAKRLNREPDRDQLELESRLQEAARAAGVRSPRAARTPGGELVASVDDASWRIDEWLELAPGRPFGPDELRGVGEVLGTLHALALPAPNDVGGWLTGFGGEERWVELRDAVTVSATKSTRPWARRFVEVYPSLLAAGSSVRGQAYDDAILAHRDLHPENLGITDDGIAVLDWERTGPIPPLQELGYVLWGWAGNTGDLEAARPIVAGYRAAIGRPVELGPEIFGCAINGGLNFLYGRVVGALHAPDDPERRDQRERAEHAVLELIEHPLTPSAVEQLLSVVRLE